MSEPFWYSENSQTKLSKEELLKLYDIYVREELGHLDFFYKYRNYYSTVLLALLATNSGILLQFYLSKILIVTTVVPISIVVLSYFGTKSIDRYYRRFLEAVVFIAKIENLLGLDKPISSELDRPLPTSPEPGKPAAHLYRSDRQFTVERYIRSRFQNRFQTSEKFMQEMMKKGDNQWAHRTFSFFMLAGSVLVVITTYIWLTNVGILPIQAIT